MIFSHSKYIQKSTIYAYQKFEFNRHYQNFDFNCQNYLNFPHNCKQDKLAHHILHNLDKNHLNFHHNHKLDKFALHILYSLDKNHLNFPHSHKLDKQVVHILHNLDNQDKQVFQSNKFEHIHPNFVQVLIFFLNCCQLLSEVHYLFTIDFHSHLNILSMFQLIKLLNHLMNHQFHQHIIPLYIMVTSNLNFLLSILQDSISIMYFIVDMFHLLDHHLQRHLYNHKNICLDHLQMDQVCLKMLNKCSIFLIEFENNCTFHFLCRIARNYRHLQFEN